MAAREVPWAEVRFRPGKGLEVRSQDGDFALNTRVRGQMLYTLVRDTGEMAHQLRIRRARLVFGGQFFGPNNRFKLELAIAPNDLGVGDNLADDPLDRIGTQSPLLDLYFDFRHLRDLSVRVGQYKLPSNRSRVISSGDLQMVDRSIVNAEFTLDRDMGLDFRSADFLGLGVLRYYAGASIGRGRDSQGFDDFGLDYFVRIEVLPFGMFNDYIEVDFERSDRARLSVGAVYAYQDRSRGLRNITARAPADGGTTDHHIAMFDAIFKHSGFSAQVEAALRMGYRNPGDAVDASGQPIAVTPPRDGFGAMLQAGYLLPNLPLEVSARVGAIRPLGDSGETSLSASHEVGGGLSWYLARHPFKVQADVFRLWPDRMSDGDTQIRVQLQAGL